MKFPSFENESMKKQPSNAKALKTLLIGVVSALALSSISAIAADQPFKRAQKEIKIMSKIFETSLNENSGRKQRFMGSRKTSATYLAKQGMVFSFDFSRHGFNDTNDWAAFGEGIGAFVGGIASEVGAALAEVPEIPDAPVAPDYSIDLEDYYQGRTERREQLELMREKHQQQREEVRKLQREIRQMESESDRLENESKADALRDQLNSKLESLKSKMQSYKKSMADYRKKRDEKYEASAQLKSQAVLTTLCDYGSTLKSLDNDEYVTLIFKNYNDNKDQVYVFEFDDIKSCDSVDKMVKSAISYQL